MYIDFFNAHQKVNAYWNEHHFQNFLMIQNLTVLGSRTIYGGTTNSGTSNIDMYKKKYHEKVFSYLVKISGTR